MWHRSALLLEFFIVCTFADYVTSFPTFDWPDALLSYADSQLYEGTRFPALAEGCAPRQDTTVAAQWLRIAYHDMSTHNVFDGTGGLDASIQFELDRSQNIGEGMFQSLADFGTLLITTSFFGTADVIALGTVFGIAACGGPIIPYRAGRADATGAGPATVPEPQQDLASHIESFRRQGFNQTEMISLVACGHTLGGVRQVDFPLVVTDNATDVATFDTTPTFDNTVVSQYLQNFSQNVLVMGPNVTTRSDLRIFSSDRNTTMQNLLSPATFNETCANLIERMINTVPSGVNLTQSIAEPFDYVVTQPLFTYRNGVYSMTTALRVLNLSDNPNRTVTMSWLDRQGSSCPPAGCLIPSSSSTTNVLNNFGHQLPGVTASARFFFNATINATSSISRFWFSIDENDGSELVVVDNGGSGYVIEQDSVFVDVQRSQIVTLIQPTHLPGAEIFRKIVLAVRGDAASSSAVMTAFDPLTNFTSPPFLPTITSTALQLDDENPPEGGFTFLTANVSLSTSSLSFTTNVAGRASLSLENFLVPSNLPLVTIF